jgi:hypothetical protein
LKDDYGGNQDFMDLEDEVNSVNVKQLTKLRKQLLKGRRVVAKNKMFLILFIILILSFLREYYLHATEYKDARDYELGVEFHGWKRIKCFFIILKYFFCFFF